jgi:L-lactate dehydrogenase complex protein LldG
MLVRVQKALGHAGPNSTVSTPPMLDFNGVMPPLEPEGYLAKFEAEVEKVGGNAHRVATLEELDIVFEQILGPAETRSATLSRNPLLSELHIADRLTALHAAVTYWTPGKGAAEADSRADFNKATFAAAVGITGVDFALAESGTLVLSSATEGAQVTSLAPPVHIALYRRNQLVGSLDEVLAQLPIRASSVSGRSVVFITGTSRTADIEQILIRGVHGPKQVHAILVEDSCR